MSIESANAFLAAVAADPAIRAECDRLAEGKDLDAYAEAFAAYARTKGYEFTGDEAAAVFSGVISDATIDDLLK